jgi:large subunit ribosomal protein L15e
MKSVYGFIRDAWKTPERTYVKNLTWQRLQVWRREPAVIRIERPTRLDRARNLGYKAKQGVIVARVRTWRGGRRKQRPRGGRRTKHLGVKRLTARKSSQWVAEERASRKFPNLEVLNSYWVGQDGKSKWYEIILVDPNHPRIIKDKSFGWTASSRRRTLRGKTSAGRKGRGLRKKGRGTEKTAPSLSAHGRRGT